MSRITILKTLSYAVMHFSIAVLIAYVLTRSWQLAFAIGLLEPFAQTIAFFFHEHFWHKYSEKQHKKDHHDSVTDSVSPVSKAMEKLLRHLEHHKH